MRKFRFMNEIVLILCCVIFCAGSAATAIPSFRIVVKYKGLGVTYAVLVPENTNRQQLKDLIFEFRKARQEGFISKMIPPTTPGGAAGDYYAIEIYFFSEPNWTTESKFKKWMESSQLSSADKLFDKEYVKHIRAYFLYSPPEEIGSIGYSGEGIKSPDYERLF
jgi:hypothetical protein